MNLRMIGRFLARIFALLAVFLLPAGFLCLADGDGRAAHAFFVTVLISLLLTGALFFSCRRAGRDFYAKEGMVCVGVAWIAISLLGALPLRLSGAFPTYIDALFEIVSGFSTTGASVAADVEVLPRGILYWRSFSHFLGGMGVLVFLLAVMPSDEKNSGFTLHLMRAESPGPDVGKLVPKIRETAGILYLTYIALTVLNLIFLLFGKMPFFDALCTAFGTAGTGGFGIKNDSMASYSPYLQNVTTVFMLLFGVNFSCYYLLMLRRVRSVWKDEELRFYGILVALTIGLIAWNVRPLYATFGETLRHSAFQVASVVTTTGFSTTDFNLWTPFSQALLLFLMLIGACAGSTGGGFKCARVLLLIKALRRNLGQLLHPKKTQTVRLNGKTIDEKVLANTSAYLCAYVSLLVVSFLVVSLDPYVQDVTTAFTASLACLNNIGPGLSGVGPMQNFAAFAPWTKIILIFDMLAGRLEIYPILLLLSPKTWQKA